ncbi:MAG: hypothetical protein U0L04_09160 [Bacteroidaceae bacterium]|nr:hypothetical protein [Bacteroidaceae bacterium]
MNRKARRAAAKALAKSLKAQGVSKAARRVQVAQARKGISFESKAKATLGSVIRQNAQERLKSAQATFGPRRARETELLNRVHNGDWRTGQFLRQASAAWKMSSEYRQGNHTRMMGWLSEEALRRGYKNLSEWEKAFEEENAELIGLTEEDDLLLSAEDPYTTGMDLSAIGYRGLRFTLPTRR